MGKPHILVVEDDLHLANLIEVYLSAEDYCITKLVSGAETLEFLKKEEPHLMILDRNLPDINGVVLCKMINHELGYHFPILMLTVQNKVQERVEGLEAGASDYISKPVDMNELKARVKAHLRIYDYVWNQRDITFHQITLKPNLTEAYFKDQPLSLNRKEFRILYQLLRSSDQVVTKTYLLSSVWQQSQPASNSLEVYVSSLRRKLNQVSAPISIENAYGEGYILKSIEEST